VMVLLCYGFCFVCMILKLPVHVSQLTAFHAFSTRNFCSRHFSPNA
jgi:hypothetical protein